MSAERPVLDLDSGVRSETIQAQQVQDMPLQGRNWVNLLKVIPGSTPINGNASTAANTPRPATPISGSTARTRARRR